MSPDSHLRLLSWYPVTWSSVCNSDVDVPPIDFIYRCRILKWVALIWLNSLRPSELTIIGSDNGSSPRRRQAIIWTNALLIGPPGTNFNEILIVIHIISFKKIHLKMSSGKWRPFCLSLNELKISHRNSSPSNGRQCVTYYLSKG